MSNKKRKNAPETIYEDEAIILINKPANLLTVPDRWEPELPNLLEWLNTRHHPHKIYTVHRLDADTSGIVIFAKSAAAHRHLCVQFEQQQVHRIYLGLVNGVMPTSHGEINLPLAESPHKPGMMMIKKGGKAAITYWEVLEQFRNYTYLKIIPQTGRMHQIRVHLKHIGYPLLLDLKYNIHNPIYLSQLKKNYIPKPEQLEKPLIDRLALHASELSFIHPLTGQLYQMTCDLPKDFKATLRNLRKYRGLKP